MSKIPADFPPLKTLEAFPSNLPVQLTSFIGREKEKAQIKKVIVSGSASPIDFDSSQGRGRLVTLTGPGGTGKTRLAMQVAAELRELFPDGVWLVELAPLADPELIPQTISGVMRVHVNPREPVVKALIDSLKQSKLLLILDNCEHVVDAVAQLVEQLQHGCPEVHILATSREILGAAGEIPIRVPSLSVPAARHLPANFSEGELEELFKYEAVRLFCDRAANAFPGFKLTGANAAAVVQVCQRLDGIPLAIELAAARVRMLSVEQIAAHLDDAFRLLTGSSRTALSRHQTLRALIDWSYDLLTQSERTLLLRLSVFSSGWTLPASEAVVPDRPGAFDVLNLLSLLVDKSLVLVEQEKGPEARYRLLDTIRQYASEKLRDLGDGEAVRDRHLDYYARLASEARPHLRASDQVQWLDRLESELDNLRAALKWAGDHQMETALTMAADLHWFWHIRGYGSEGMDLLESLFAKEGEQSTGQPRSPARKLALARANNTAGFILNFQNERARSFFEAARSFLADLGPLGQHTLAVTRMALGMMNPDWDQAIEIEKESLAIFRGAGDIFYIAECLRDLSILAINREEYEESKAYLLENLALRQQINDLDGMGDALRSLGSISFIQGRSVEAGIYLDESLEAFHKVGNRRFECTVLYSQSGVDLAAGFIERAAQKCEQMIRMGTEQNDPEILADGLSRMGRILWNQGTYDLARSRYEGSLELAQQRGSRLQVARAHLGLGVVSLSEGKFPEAYYRLVESLSLGRETPDPQVLGFSLVALAHLARGARRPKTASQLLGLAKHLIPSNSSKILSPVELHFLENLGWALQDTPEGRAYHPARLDDQEISLDQAWELVLGLGSAVESQQVGVEPVPRMPATAALIEPLSPREIEIVKMLAAGCTNLEIAQKLFIDVGTVKSHNTHIFAKLDVKNRSQAAAKARGLGLV